MGQPMSSLTEFFAAFVLWLASLALCQFGGVLEREAKAPPRKAERTVARTPRQQAIRAPIPAVARCPQAHALASDA